MKKIATNENITFEEEKKYLDKVSIETLINLEKDIDEIIYADEGEVLPQELAAKDNFSRYLETRRMYNND